jgi:hypothetical protein
MKKPNKNKAAIAYSIVGHDLAAHLFRVSLTVARRPKAARFLPCRRGYRAAT